MATLNLDAYLFFDGDCREAMEFYQGIFGGKLNLSTFGENGGAPAPGMEDRIMHSFLEGDVRLMGSDGMPEDAKGTGKVRLSLSGTDEAKLKDFWSKLCDGGKVVTPLDKAPWGDQYGAATDKYDVDWMFNIISPENFEKNSKM